MPILSLHRPVQNSGNVKVLGYDDGGTQHPTILMDSTDGFTTFAYGNSNLVFAAAPTTTWPDNDPIKGAGSIWNDTDGRFLENITSGQANVWRLSLLLSRPGGGISPIQSSITYRLYNPVSGFDERRAEIIPRLTETPMPAVVNFLTVADGNSIGSGYQIGVEDVNVNGTKIELVSLLRTTHQSAQPFTRTSMNRVDLTAQWKDISGSFSDGGVYTMANAADWVVELAEGASPPGASDSRITLFRGQRVDFYYSGTAIWARGHGDAALLDVLEAH